jgi:hypothetical protein
MSGVFARKIANIDKHKWRIIASGGSRILDSELNVTNVLLSIYGIYLSYTPDDIKDFASQILKNKNVPCRFCKSTLYLFHALSSPYHAIVNKLAFRNIANSLKGYARECFKFS